MRRGFGLARVRQGCDKCSSLGASAPTPSMHNPPLPTTMHATIRPKAPTKCTALGADQVHCIERFAPACEDPNDRCNDIPPGNSTFAASSRMSKYSSDDLAVRTRLSKYTSDDLAVRTRLSKYTSDDLAVRTRHVKVYLRRLGGAYATCQSIPPTTWRCARDMSKYSPDDLAPAAGKS
jgi:hypothetical protein